MALYEMLFAGYYRMAFIIDMIITIGKDGYIGLEKSAIQLIAYYTNTVCNLVIENRHWDTIDDIFLIIALAFSNIVFQRKRKEPPGKNTSRQPKKVK